MTRFGRPFPLPPRRWPSSRRPKRRRRSRVRTRLPSNNDIAFAALGLPMLQSRISGSADDATPLRPGAAMSDFHRVRRLPPYVFEQVNTLKAKARAAGADIVDLGMGNPDLPAPKHVIDKLVETVGKPRTDRYSASKGIAGLRRAQAGYYARRFGVKLDPETQVVATLGSKEGFANMAQAITAPGDVVLVPNPSYPIHAFGFLMAGGVIRSVPSEPTPELFAALERAIVHSI